MPSLPPLTVYFRQLAPDCAVVRVHGEVDVDTIGVLTTALAHAVDAYPLVTCDLSGVSFFGAAGANVIARAVQRAAAREHRLEVSGAHGAAREVLLIAGLGTMLRIPG